MTAPGHVPTASRVKRDGSGTPVDYLKPYADLHVTHMKTSAYDESGADVLDLQVGSASATTVSVSPMLEAGKRFDFGNGMTLPAATAELPDTRYKLNAGVNLLASSKFDVRLEYTGEFASGYRSNTETLKLNYLF
jgi:outer membrane autotransporter protein